MAALEAGTGKKLQDLPSAAPATTIAFSYDNGATWTALHRFCTSRPTDCTNNCRSGWGCEIGWAYPHGTDRRLRTIPGRLA
ncbi:hypothetical protein AB0K15_35435 [Amycolatopsis sp. NPDC049253]|uniref:hypothetical protein n=1 Tax=Amycolatopsis sp. NPDC049253 TaxID=3155274 RepID=UPI0034448B66